MYMKNKQNVGLLHQEIVMNWFYFISFCNQTRIYNIYIHTLRKQSTNYEKNVHNIYIIVQGKVRMDDRGM